MRKASDGQCVGGQGSADRNGHNDAVTVRGEVRMECCVHTCEDIVLKVPFLPVHALLYTGRRAPSMLH